MGRIIKALLVLALAAFLGLVGYAYLGDLTPAQAPVSKPVTLDAP
jgi:predicted small integral membrane protein